MKIGIMMLIVMSCILFIEGLYFTIKNQDIFPMIVSLAIAFIMIGSVFALKTNREDKNVI